MTRSEHAEQVAVMQWAALQTRRWPELQMLYAIPNGGLRGKATAARLKAEGVKAGVPDLHLPVPRGMHCGLWIEMKAARGRTSPDQKKWLEWLSEVGHAVHVCHGADEAFDVLSRYLELRS